MAAERALNLASKYSYFTALLSRQSRKHITDLNLGHSGSLFQENIKSEWMHSNVVNRDVSVYLYVYNGLNYNEKDFLRSFRTTYETSKGKYPFGIAESYVNTKEIDNDSEKSYFQLCSSKILSSTIFIPSSDSMQYFLHWQRQRKLWWKKISAFPGRFQLSDIKVLDDDGFSVDIFADFSWGNQLLETITISPMSGNVESGSIKMISNKLSLDIAAITLFCDAYNEDLLTNTRILKLNRRLTPYKCIFAVNKSEPSETEELAQLSFYLNKLFRKAGIPTVLLSDSTTSSTETQFQRNDEWGIPYTVVLDENTLKSGIVGLRNRDTTLLEEVHVSELTEYVNRLFNNFKK